MALRMTGLMSGMDTESIVKAMMDAKAVKKIRIENKKTKLEWTQDKWKTLNTKLYSLYTDKVSNMRLQGSYNIKKASISDASIAGISAKSTAINGSYSLEVNNIATSNYVTSGKLSLSSGASSDKVTSSTKLSELDGESTLVGKEISISYNGKSTTLSVTEDTTVEKYISALKSVGLSASFDETQQRIFTSSAASGADNNFSVTVLSQEGVDARSALRNVVSDYDSLDDAKKSQVNSLIDIVSHFDTTTDEYKKAMNDLYSLASGNSSNEEVDNAVSMYRQALENDGSGNALSALGMTSIVEGKAVGTKPEGMAVITGTDSEIILNGATLTGSDTTINANGLSIELKGLTHGTPISFSISNDTDAVYNSIKDFIGEYNAVLSEMNTAFHAASARGYEPLTEEERAAMSEEQIELWEGKIKDSLLKNDSTLDGIINAMKGAMMTPVVVDGKSYSLSNLGIMTSSDYTEYGLLHIYGDSDDATYADKPDKLRTLLENDPELVTKILSGVTSNLYDAMNKKMASSSLSSALTFYNDKQITKQISSYESEISKWEARLTKIEDKYYSQFTAMEKALANLQSAQSVVSQLTNGGS